MKTIHSNREAIIGAFIILMIMLISIAHGGNHRVIYSSNTIDIHHTSGMGRVFKREHASNKHVRVTKMFKPVIRHFKR